jgi:hypothetical protein
MAVDDQRVALDRDLERTRRPMRPNPLMATLTAIVVFSDPMVLYR